MFIIIISIILIGICIILYYNENKRLIDKNKCNMENQKIYACIFNNNIRENLNQGKLNLRDILNDYYFDPKGDLIPQPPFNIACNLELNQCKHLNNDFIIELEEYIIYRGSYMDKNGNKITYLYLPNFFDRSYFEIPLLNNTEEFYAWADKIDKLYNKDDFKMINLENNTNADIKLATIFEANKYSQNGYFLAGSGIIKTLKNTIVKMMNNVLKEMILIELEKKANIKKMTTFDFYLYMAIKAESTNNDTYNILEFS